MAGTEDREMNVSSSCPGVIHGLPGEIGIEANIGENFLNVVSYLY